MSGSWTIDDLIPAVKEEIDRARQKYKNGEQTSDDTWYRIIGEELGEVAKLLDDEGIDEQTNILVNEELIQAAATIFNWIEFRNQRST